MTKDTTETDLLRFEKLTEKQTEEHNDATLHIARRMIRDIVIHKRMPSISMEEAVSLAAQVVELEHELVQEQHGHEYTRELRDELEERIRVIFTPPN